MARIENIRLPKDHEPGASTPDSPFQIVRRFVCSRCSAELQKWSSQCPSCQAVNSVSEDIRIPPRDTEGVVVVLPSTQIEDNDVDMIPTGIGELDRVLGGGIVLGGVYLFYGDPGCGKSTLLGQALGKLALQDIRTLHITGEEKRGQVANRARRLGIEHDNLLIAATSELESILDVIDHVEPTVVVIDSIQTVRTEGLDASSSIAGLRSIAKVIIDACKERNIAAFLIGHVNKEGVAAGPKTLEHLVDACIALENDRTTSLRILRADKCRFGSTSELGLFEMTSHGFKEVPSASEWLLAERRGDTPGSMVAGTIEGSRSILVEIQALMSGKGGKRYVTGVDSSRVSVLLAVLQKLVPRVLGTDLFINTAGGARITDIGSDLAVLLAIASSALERPISGKIAAFGEVSLAGEVRGVGRGEMRVQEALNLGFTRIIVPISFKMKAPAGVKLVRVGTVREALKEAFGEFLIVNSPLTDPSDFEEGVTIEPSSNTSDKGSSVEILLDGAPRGKNSRRR